MGSLLNTCSTSKLKVRVEEVPLALPDQRPLTCSPTHAETIMLNQCRMTPGSWNAALVWGDQLTHSMMIIGFRGLFLLGLFSH